MPDERRASAPTGFPSAADRVGRVGGGGYCEMGAMMSGCSRELRASCNHGSIAAFSQHSMCCWLLACLQPWLPHLCAGLISAGLARGAGDDGGAQRAASCGLEGGCSGVVGSGGCQLGGGCPRSRGAVSAGSLRREGRQVRGRRGGGSDRRARLPLGTPLQFV